MSAAINRIKELIDINQLKNEDFTHFVLQGGAGSGKTESLKEIISYISRKYPHLQIACITHTNAAVDEISGRVNNNKYKISTIHSFLNDLIKNYKKNIHTLLPTIFTLSTDAIINHKEYKKRHEKLSKKKFQIENEILGKVIGKRDYDKNPDSYNRILLNDINALNSKIIDLINVKDYKDIKYNETKFDSLEDLSFSHDSLLDLSFKLSEKFGLLPKIISDKFDFIFIDEYQDTNPLIIKLFLELLPNNKRTTIGLFGDSMQGIYDDGIGSVQTYINKGTLSQIDKDDNFRCSEQVITFINNLRNDSIKQELALKIGEVKEVRQGSVRVFIKSIGNKPSSRASEDEKNLYLNELKNSISAIKTKSKDKIFKTLLLTNKSISTELNFQSLYNIFNDRYTDVKDEIEKELSRIQVDEIIILISLFKEKKYNELLVKCKKNGFVLMTLKDKTKLIECLSQLQSADYSLQSAIDYCISNKLIRKSEKAKNYDSNRENFINSFNSNDFYIELEKYHKEGHNTLTRVNEKYELNLQVQEYDDFLYALKKKVFYEQIFSEDVKLSEVINYFNYLNEEAEYITMHKTKGSGIENVLVVLDEYFWTKYNFKSIYDENEKSLYNQKLFYVACSRAIKDLAVLRFVEDDSEETLLRNYFKDCEIIPL